MKDLTERVRDYWTVRSHDFATVRNNELEDAISGRWIDEMNRYLPREKNLRILDAGTGTGYFSILLSKEGHLLCGIDLTQAMIDEAQKTAASQGVAPEFMVMDAQETSFDDEVFDAVVTRNLTWTLSDPRKAYGEWFRILRRGGVLLNFDADYASNVRNQNQKESRIEKTGAYGHIGLTPELSRENALITLAMPAGGVIRPGWDLGVLGETGFSGFGADPGAGKRILREKDLSDAPMFLIWAVK